MRRDLSFARMVGARMRDFRLGKGLSLVQLHARGAPSPSQMSSIERGLVDFTVDTICDVAKALDMRPWQMLVPDECLASLDLGEAKRILFVLPELELPERLAPRPPRKAWDRVKARKAERKGGV